MSQYEEELKALAAEAVQVRRYFHENAELSFQEDNTAAFIRDRLASYGVEFEEGYSGNSTVCSIRGEQDGPVIAFRADIDALPIQEDNDLPFCSKNAGVMHACGHDAHAAVLLALVRFFSEHRDLIRGKIKFIFQQGEEKLPGGAGILCREGVMNDVDEIYGWHAAAVQPIGEVSLVEGHSHAAVGEYRLVIRGKGGHGGFPFQANNPILCASTIANILNQMVTTKVDPLKAAVITTAYIHSGTDRVPNVIPSECIMGGNIRTLDNELIEQMYAWTEQICRTQCEAYGCDYDFQITRGYPSTELGGHPMEVMAEVVEDMGLKNTVTIPQMGAEDFSYYTLEKPAGFLMVGMQDPRDADNPTPHHNPRFRIDDENGFPVALEFCVRCYLKAVAR